MEIEYNRNIRSSNMMITCTGPMETMEEIMMTKNRIHGLIPVKFRRVDEKIVFHYDITGKQALDALLESHNADEHMLLSLLAGIGGILERLDKYLLVQEHLLLRPECIFLDYKTEEIWFCYCPGNGQELPEAFRRLMEYLLTKTDHKDERAVEIAYGVYEEALKQGYSLEMIKESLHLWEGNRLNTANTENELPLKQKENPLVADGKKPIENANNMEMADKGMKIFPELKKYFRSQFWKNKIADACRSSIKFQMPSFSKKNKEIVPFVFEPEEEEQSTGRPTVLLAEKKRTPQGILRYEGTHGLNDLNLTHFPYVIGSSTSCDGVIAQDTVSREHARITKTEEVYFIEDLNSLNGTIVGGELLQYKLKVSLEINEAIVFANEKYRFL